ncbi:MAG TPA: alpha/beta fold hydrolase [Gaiellaceae bacterium]|nr:alpha/beta fold hydrolase [Gaiellaceae bacterium]
MRPLTTTEHAVLGLIAFGERSGYDLARGAEWSVGAMWAPSRSQIYKVLPRLVALGCARVRAVEQETRPDKALYSITRRGRETLRAWVEEVEDEPAGGSSIFLMKIFFGWAGPPDAATRQLEAYEAWLRRRRARFETMAAGLPDDEPVHSRLALEHALGRISATLVWAASARARLAAVVAASLALVLLAASPNGSALDGCSPRAGDVAFRAADGVRLAGHVFGQGRVGVVLAHQSNGTTCQWSGYGRRLARLGYMPLALDFRGHGGSASASFAASLRLGGDLAAAVRYLRAHGARKVYLVGASMGGSAVLVGGANIRPPVDGVVAVSAADYLLDAPGAAARLRVPVLYLAGSRDPGAADQARRLFKATHERTKSLGVYDDWRHGVDLVDGNAAARSRVERFLAR